MLNNRLLPLWIPTRRCDLQGLTKTMRMCTTFMEIQVLRRNVYVTFLKEIIQKGKDKKAPIRITISICLQIHDPKHQSRVGLDIVQGS